MVVTCSAPGGALHRAVDPEAAQWTPATYLLANVTDLLSVQIWAQSKKGTKKPDPTWRPHQKAKKKGRNLTQIARDGVSDGR